MTRPAVVAVAVALLVGCQRPPAPVPKATAKPAATTDDPLDPIRDSFRKSADAEAFRRLSDQINVLFGRGGVTLPTPADRAAWRKQLLDLGLTADEIAEVERPEMTPLDAPLLDEATLFRDIAGALDLNGLPPAEQAAAALAWLARNVRLVQTPPEVPTPPQYVVLRGLGTPTERLFAGVALLRQAGLDAAFVVDPADDSPWGLAVLAGDAIHVFDGRLGVPLGATWAELQANPQLVGKLTTDPAHPYDITPERAAASVLRLPFRLGGLSPRLAWLQGVARDRTPPRIADDPFADLARWQKAAGDRVGVARTPNTLAYARAWRAFVPVQAGGADRTGVLVERLLQRPVPWKLLPPFVRDLPGEPGERLRRAFAGPFLQPIQPGGARDLVVRGRGEEATAELSRNSAVRRGPSSSQLEPAARAWCDEARSLTAEMLRTERAARDGDPAARQAADAARQAFTQHQTKAPAVTAYLSALVSDPVGAAAVLQLGLGKHDQAEAQWRRGGDAATDNARAANSWYTNYRVNHADGDALGHVIGLQARIIARTEPERLADAKAAVKGTALHPLDKVGVLATLK